VKRALYHSGIKQRYTSSLPTIVVGNLSMGGTGKTPISSYLIELLLSEGKKVAYLSRGYGRESKGLKEVVASSKSQEVGDEALMIKNRYQSISAWVCENRVEGVKHIEVNTDAEVVVLDDAYQHLQFRAGFYLLLSTVRSPFFKDWIFPSGMLREPRREASQADAIIFTKASDSLVQSLLPDQYKQSYTALIPHFFTGLSYSYEITEVFGQSTLPIDAETPVFTFSAIARNADFFEAVSGRFSLVEQMGFRDHHSYTKEDFVEIKARFQALKKEFGNLIILTTEKDAARLRTLDGASELDLIPLFYWSISPKFLLNSKTSFDSLITNYVKRDKRSS